MPVWNAVGELGFHNRYSYTGGNPINRVDRNGMCWNNADATLDQQQECSRLFHNRFVSSGSQGMGVVDPWAIDMQQTWSQWSYEDFMAEANRNFRGTDGLFSASSTYLVRDVWNYGFVESQWSQDIRNNPEDAFLTIVYAGGSIVLLAATGGGAAFIIGVLAVSGGNLLLDAIKGDPLSLSDVPASQIVGGGLMNRVASWFFAGGELAAFVSKGELFLYGVGLASWQQTFELAVDYFMDGEVNLNSFSSYVANLLLNGSDNFLPNGNWSEILELLFKTGSNFFVNWLNSGGCPEQ